MKNTLKTATLIALVSLSAHVAQATTTVIYNSTGAAQFGSDAISSSAGGPLADEFLTGNSPSILSQTVILFYVPATASTSGTISAGLYSNANGPATLLSTLGTVPNNSTTLSNTYVTDQFYSSYQLAANTEYWIELSSSDTQWNWLYALNSTGVGVAGQDVYLEGAVANTQGSVFEMELSTTDVTSASPEPATLALCGFSFLCLAARLRCRRS
jgi:hypothetical protein